MKLLLKCFGKALFWSVVVIAALGGMWLFVCWPVVAFANSHWWGWIQGGWIGLMLLCLVTWWIYYDETHEETDEDEAGLSD